MMAIFFRLFKTNQNINSISLKNGLAIGTYRGSSYFLKITPKNMIESCVYLDGIWEPHIIDIISSYLEGLQVILLLMWALM
jgi:hypothetical protein